MHWVDKNINPKTNCLTEEVENKTENKNGREKINNLMTKERDKMNCLLEKHVPILGALYVLFCVVNQFDVPCQ